MKDKNTKAAPSSGAMLLLKSMGFGPDTLGPMIEPILKDAKVALQQFNSSLMARFDAATADTGIIIAMLGTVQATQARQEKMLIEVNSRLERMELMLVDPSPAAPLSPEREKDMETFGLATTPGRIEVRGHLTGVYSVDDYTGVTVMSKDLDNEHPGAD